MSFNTYTCAIDDDWERDIKAYDSEAAASEAAELYERWAAEYDHDTLTVTVTGPNGIVEYFDVECRMERGYYARSKDT